jgi:hypothetical protein
MKRSIRRIAALDLDTCVPGPGVAASDLTEARRLLQATGSRAARAPQQPAHLSFTPLGSPLDFDRPDWARGVHIARRLGPFVRDGGLSVWVDIPSLVHLVPFYRMVNGQTQVLAYLPLSSLPGSGGAKASISLPGGTLRICMSELVPTVPAQAKNLFAGTRIKTGMLKSNKPMTVSAKGVRLAPGATADLTVTLDPQPATGGDPSLAQDALTAEIALPVNAAFHFGNGCQVTALGALQATLYGTTVTLSYQGAAPEYLASGDVKECLIPCTPSTTTFDFADVKSETFRPSGAATVARAAWSMPVAADTGTTFSEIAQAGALYLDLQGDVCAAWAPHLEPRRFSRANLWVAPGLIGSMFWQLQRGAQDHFDLWRDRSNDQKRCRATMSYAAGDGLFHVAFGGHTEGLVIPGVASARLDRPVRITGVPVPVGEIAALTAIGRTTAGLQVALFGFGLTEAGKLLLDQRHRYSSKNGVLTCGVPQGLVLTGSLQGASVETGRFWLGLPTHQLLLTLPDPYVISRDAPFDVSGAGMVRVAWHDAAHTGHFAFGVQLQSLEEQPSTRQIPPQSKTDLTMWKARALVDVSGLADHFGVYVHVDRIADSPTTAAADVALEAGMLAVPGRRMMVVTLPSISWEPMVALPLPVPKPANPPDPEEYVLRVIAAGKEGDGSYDRVYVPTVNLVRIAPEDALHEYVNAAAKQAAVVARLNLPFGLVGWLSPQTTDTFAFNQPHFSDKLRGGLQLKLVPPNPQSARAVFQGHMEIVGGFMGYGQRVLGRSVGEVFGNEFGVIGSKPAVPLRRYDLSGRGASVFSDWRDEDLEHSKGAPDPNGVGVVKAAFNVLVGRTGYEEIIVQAVIHPWGIKVRRTVTINRQQAGWVIRRDSGWVPVSPSMFIPFAVGTDQSRVHHGLIDRLIGVERIAEVADPLLAGVPNAQAVRFDATALLVPHAGTWLVSGGSSALGQEAIACQDVWGFLLLNPTPPGDPLNPNSQSPPNAEDLGKYFAAFQRSPARGKVACVIDIGGTGQLLRAMQIEASPTLNPGGQGHLVLALAGSPVLPRAGAWSVSRRAQLDAEPQALAADYPVPVIQPNGNNLWHLADCRDVFALRLPGATALPQNEYGLLQGTGTQKIYFPYPQFEAVPAKGVGSGGRLRVPDGDQFKLADVRSLLRSTGLFPPGLEALLTDLTEAEMPTLGADGFSFAKTWTLDPNKVETVIDTSAAKVMLRYASAVQNGDITNPVATRVDVQVDASTWSISLGPLSFELHAMGERLLAVSFANIAASTTGAPQFSEPELALGAKLKPIGDLLTALKGMSLPTGSKAPRAGGGSGLRVDFADGRLSIGDTVALPNLPLGFGTVSNIQLDLGGTLSFMPASIEFGVGLGTEQNPMTLILSPFAGTALVRLAIGSEGHRIIVRAGLGLALAIDIGIASGSASIIIAIQVEIGDSVRIAGILTGHAGVDVLGGIASAGLTLEAGAGVSPDMPDSDHVRLDAYVAVGIHISICWVIDIDFDTSWPFETDVARGI